MPAICARNCCCVCNLCFPYTFFYLLMRYVTHILSNSIFPNIAQLFRIQIYLEKNLNFNFLKEFDTQRWCLILDIRRDFLRCRYCNKGCFESSSLCSLESFCLARKETHRDDIKGTLFTYPLPSNLNRESFSRSVGEPSHFRSPDPFSLCARMTCKEWNPQEHLRPAPWQRIAISARLASSRSFCARDREEQISLRNEIELILR